MMKPNDKAIEALAKVIEDRLPEEGDSGLSEFERQVFANDMAVDGLAAAYAAQFQSEEYADLIRSLRGEPPTNSTLDPLRAADALETVLAERDALRKWKEDDSDAMRIFARYRELEAERDALAARLAPVEDDKLVEIAAVAIRRNKFERTGRLDCFDPSNLTPEELGEGRAAIAAIRPHIEAAEGERCAKKIEPTGPRPSDCDSCDCGNKDDAERVAAWDEAMANAAAIRSGK